MNTEQMQGHLREMKGWALESWGRVTHDPRFYELLGIDATKETVVGFFFYGVPKVVPEQKRKPLEEIVLRRP